MSDLKRIADVSTNIGEAVLVRVNPELAEDEHNYFSTLRAGNDKKFNEQYEEAGRKYMDRIKSMPQLVTPPEDPDDDAGDVAD
jgi:diaminopimelate decarboxylase